MSEYRQRLQDAMLERRARHAAGNGSTGDFAELFVCAAFLAGWLLALFGHCAM